MKNDSYEAIADRNRRRAWQVVDLLHTDEKCVEWHAWYEDRDGELWQIDMIHIEAGSAYDGYFERFARRLQRTLTPEMRQAVLRLKFETPDHEKISGVEIYRAVVQGGVRTRAELERWRAEHPLTGISEWMP